MKNDNCSDTAFMVSRDITRPVVIDPWCQNWQPGDDERQRDADAGLNEIVAAYTICEVVARIDKTEYPRKSRYANGGIIYFRNLFDANQYADNLVHQKHNGIVRANVVLCNLPVGSVFWSREKNETY
jgi:hypothetical protein